MKKQMFKCGSAVLLSLFMVACGGGGGDGGDTISPVLPQGLWDAATPAGSVYILPAAANSGAVGEVWAIGRTSPNALLQGFLRVSGASFEANAARYMTSDSAEAADVRIALVTTGGDLALTVTGSTLEGTQTISGLTRSATYDRSATLADWEGCWQIVGDPVESKLCVSDIGVISGSRGSCEFSGAVSLRAEAKAVVNVELQESVCPDASSFSGIGVFGRENDQVVEDARVLALKNPSSTLRSLVRLQRSPQI
jgi:hypothetical protein